MSSNSRRQYLSQQYPPPLLVMFLLKTMLAIDASRARSSGAIGAAPHWCAAGVDVRAHALEAKEGLAVIESVPRFPFKKQQQDLDKELQTTSTNERHVPPQRQPSRAPASRRGCAMAMAVGIHVLPLSEGPPLAVYIYL